MYKLTEKWCDGLTNVTNFKEGESFEQVEAYAKRNKRNYAPYISSYEIKKVVE